nr:IS21 family transposase [Methylomonas koyamae]
MSVTNRYPAGLSYSMFCLRNQEFMASLKRSMRQIHMAGEKVFVDYAGPTLLLTDRVSGFVRQVQIFVGALGASCYIYAEGHLSQSLPNWIAAHVRMFEFFGSVPAAVVCDNLKSAVNKASRREPVINATYQNLADHYGTVISPARPYKPKDKAKAENGVLIVERWILFRLRKRVFHSLAELNQAIAELLVDLNNRPLQKLPGCRREAFETLDRPAKQPLPASPYQYEEFHKARVGLDYHVEFDRCYYSVPYQYKKQDIELRITASTLEVLSRGRRVASHARQFGIAIVTVPEHMEAAHRHYGLWQPDQALAWAEQVGSHLRQLMAQLLNDTKTHEQGYRLHNMLKGLAKEFGEDRLNPACQRAIEIGATSVSNVRSILRNQLDRWSRLKKNARKPTSSMTMFAAHSTIIEDQKHVKSGNITQIA